MKKTKLILIAILIGTTSTVSAQEEPYGFSLGQYLNHLFAPMDSSRFITTGLFMDKGGMDSSIFWFRNSEIDSISDIDDWYQLYYSSYNAQTQNHQNLQHLDSIVKRVEHYRNKGEIPVLGLLFDYNYIDSNAFDNGILDTADGQI